MNLWIPAYLQLLLVFDCDLPALRTEPQRHPSLVNIFAKGQQ